MKYKGTAYIHTIGCQMNVYDSEKLAAILASYGFEKTDAKESKSAKIAQLNKENAMLKQHNQELDAKLHYLKSQVADVINSA